MKKSNTLLIATLLLLFHSALLWAIVGKKDKKTPPPAPRHPTAQQAEEPAPTPAPEKAEPFFASLLDNNDTPQPRESTPAPPNVPAETIATPAHQPGYLRNDQPDRKTDSNASKLVGATYQGAIVVDARTGKILFQNHATDYAYPASVTKLMTLLLVLEHVEAGKIHLSDPVEITKEVSEIGGSEVFLDPRETGFYTVDNLLQALMIHSANDAARALALHVSGTRDAFVALMNKRAEALGMNATHYQSEHGLPPSDGSQPDISTPYDIALLCMEILKHPKALEYTSTSLAWLPKSGIRKERFMLANRNALVRGTPYAGCDGLKTGYHARGGYSLAATAKRGDQRVLAVLLGVPDKNTRNKVIKELLDKGFEKLAEPE